MGWPGHTDLHSNGFLSLILTEASFTSTFIPMPVHSAVHPPFSPFVYTSTGLFLHCLHSPTRYWLLPSIHPTTHPSNHSPQPLINHWSTHLPTYSSIFLPPIHYPQFKHLSNHSHLIYLSTHSISIFHMSIQYLCKHPPTPPPYPHSSIGLIILPHVYTLTIHSSTHLPFTNSYILHPFIS